MKDWDSMTNEELVVLYQQTNNDKLFEYFLTRNEGLMYTFIGKYSKKYPQYADDLEQVGKIAMWEAMNAYKPEKGTMFSTIYFYYVKKQVNIYRRSNDTIRIPAYVLEDLDRYVKNPNGRILSTMSLNESAGYEDDPDVTLEDLVASNEPTPEDILIAEQERVALEPMLNNLKPREEYVVRLWLGLDIGRPRTLEECGQIVGVTRERIRQIVAKAIKRLRSYAHLYYDVPHYDPTKDIHNERPKTALRNYTDKTIKGRPYQRKN